MFKSSAILLLSCGVLVTSLGLLVVSRRAALLQHQVDWLTVQVASASTDAGDSVSRVLDPESAPSVWGQPYTWFFSAVGVLMALVAAVQWHRKAPGPSRAEALHARDEE